MLRLDNPTSSNLGSGVGFFCFCFFFFFGGERKASRQRGQRKRDEGPPDRRLHIKLPSPSSFPSLPPLLGEIVITILTAVNLTHSLLSQLIFFHYEVRSVD